MEKKDSFFKGNKKLKAILIVVPIIIVIIVVILLFSNGYFQGTESSQQYESENNYYVESRTEEFKETFLNAAYRTGYSTTWKEVLDHTFKYYDISVVESTRYENGFLITISGEYSINPVDLPNTTRYGELIMDVKEDWSDGVIISGDDVIDACDIYMALATKWYYERDW